VARMAYNAARADGPHLLARRAPGAALRSEKRHPADSLRRTRSGRLSLQMANANTK
jgi:hypothetical protein